MSMAQRLLWSGCCAIHAGGNMSHTLWIVSGVSVFVIVGFAVAIRSLLRENREIDKHIDYSKVRPWVDDDEDDDRSDK
jgi:hypothetical protein